MRRLWITWTAIVAAFAPGASPALAGSGDGQDMMLLGRWSRGPCEAVQVDGTIVTIGDGADVVVLDAADPGASVELSRITLPSAVEAIERVGTSVYVQTRWSGVHAVDLSDVETPQVLGTVAPAPVRALAVEGNLLFTGASGLVEVWDVSGGGTGVLYAQLTGVPFVDGLDVAGGLVLISHESSGFSVAEVGDASLNLLVTEPNASPRSVALVAGHAYVAEFAQLRIFDLETPDSPVELTPVPTLGNAVDLELAGTTLFLIRTQHVLRVDVSDPTMPVEQQSRNMGFGMRALRASGGTVWVAAQDRGLHALDDVTLLGGESFETRGQAIGVATRWGTAYVSTSRGLVVLDVSDPQAPAELGRLELPLLDGVRGGVEIVALQWPHVYLPTQIGGLRVVDVSDSSDPEIVATYDEGGAWIAYDAAVDGNLLHLATSDGLVILDVTNPAAPVPRGEVVTSATAWAVSSGGSLVFLSLHDNPQQEYSTRIIDVSNPDAPAEIGMIALDGNRFIYRTARRADRLYVMSYDGVHVFDIANPTAPVEVGMRSMSGNPSGMSLTGDFLSISGENSPSGEERMSVYGLENPLAPELVAWIETGSIPRGVAADGNNLVIADDRDGVWVVTSDLVTPVEISELHATRDGGEVTLRWEVRMREALEGLYIYRGRGTGVALERLNDSPIGASARVFVDADAPPDALTYWLEAAELDGGRRMLTSIEVDARPASLPAPHAPNPFDPPGAIAYELPGASRVTMDVFDGTGRLVVRLVNAVQPPGNHTARWDGRDRAGRRVSSGTYLVRLRAGSESVTRRLLIVR